MKGMGLGLFKYDVLLLQRGAAAAMEAFAEPQLEKAPAAVFCRMSGFFPRFQAFFSVEGFLSFWLGEGCVYNMVSKASSRSASLASCCHRAN